MHHVPETMFKAAITAAGGRLTITGQMVDLAATRDLVEIRCADSDEVTYSVVERKPEFNDYDVHWVRAHAGGGFVGRDLQDWVPGTFWHGEWWIPGFDRPAKPAEIGPRIERPAEEPKPDPLDAESPHAMRKLQRGVACRCMRLMTDKLDPEQHFCCQPAPDLKAGAIGAA